MSKRKPAASRHENAKPAIVEPWPRRWLLAALAAMLVVQVLLPGDANTPAGGAGVPLVMLWLLLTLAYSVIVLGRGQGGVRFGATDAVVLALVAMHSLSGIWATSHAAARPAINVTWEWVATGCCFFLVRQLIRRPAEARAVAGAMIALAVGLSAVAFFEVAYELPRKRSQYQADPDNELRKALGVGSQGEIDPLAQRRFEARLYSPEPVATFNLTNSLAGYLAPWLVVAAGAAIGCFRSAGVSRQARIGLVVCTLAMAAAIVMTNSRTAWVAVAVGCTLLAMLMPVDKLGFLKRPGCLMLAIGAVLAAVVIFFVSDNSRVTAARKSLHYRVEYWQATAQMIWDRPLLGCGPGNFADTYTAYKLPEAAEEIADPHNFLLEVWATAGTFAAIAVLVAIGSFLLRAFTASSTGEVDRLIDDKASRIAARYLLLGAAAGVPLAWMLGFLFAPVFEARIEWPAALIVAGAFLVTIAMLDSWIARGKLTSRLAAIGVLVLLVHLSAAGGIGNHGVAATLWVLMALGLNAADGYNGTRPIGQAAAISAIVALIVVTVICQRTAYSPVVQSKSALSAALSASWNLEAFQYDPIDKLREAAASDSLATEPQRRIAMSSGNASEFEAAAAQWVRNAPHRSSTYRDLGNVYLRLHRSRDANRGFLARATEAYRQAIRCYPNRAILHAHLAWALHLDGDATAAKAAAADALRLDDLNPHADQKLDSGNFPFAHPDVSPKSIRRRMERLIGGAAPTGS